LNGDLNFQTFDYDYEVTPEKTKPSNQQNNKPKIKSNQIDSTQPS